MTTKNLYISDLDGTLLRNDATLSPYSKSALLKFFEAGLDLTFASARSAVTMRQILGELPLKLPVIEFNGAMASDYHTGQHLFTAHIDQAIVNTCYDMITDLGAVPFLSAIDCGHDKLYWSGIHNDGMQWYMDNRRAANDPRLHHIDDLSTKLHTEIVCITVVQREQTITKLADQLRAQCDGQLQLVAYENQYSPGWWWLTLHAGTATKGCALQKVIDLHNLSDHRTVVFGDQINDIDMFIKAHHAVAMQNAVPQLIPHADEQIATNEQDAVVNYIAEKENIEL